MNVDYWDVKKNSDNSYTCENKLKINPKHVSNTDRCNGINPVTFTGPTSKDTICNKYNWSKRCGVIWDGISNNSLNHVNYNFILF